MKTQGCILPLTFWPGGSIFLTFAALLLLIPGKLAAANDPSIDSPPQNQVTLWGSNVVFSAAASGTAPLSYQWTFNGTPLTDGPRISGSTNSTLTISDAQMSDIGAYQLVVTNTVGTNASTNAGLFVVPVLAWGDSIYGQDSVPLTLTNAIAIAAGTYFSLTLNNDGTVSGWGNDNSAQIDIPAGLTNAVAVAAGYDNSMAITNGGVLPWGGYNGGQSNVPPAATNVVAIAAGQQFSLVLKSDGTVIGWGVDNFGQADPPAGLTNVVAIAAGEYHALALKDDDTVVGWGYGQYGDTTLPAGASNIVAISAGADHSLALQSDGTVVAWGFDREGQIDVTPGLNNAVAIAAGWEQSLALRRDGTVVAWGDVTAGERNIPPGLTNVVAIAANGGKCLALVDNPATPRPPTIGWQVTNRAYAAGQSALFLPCVNGSSPLNFQWFLNGAPLTGETNKWLLVPSIQLTQTGNYQFVVTNNYGAITSQVMAISELPAVATGPSNQAVLLGSNVTFSATATGSAVLGYQWTFNGLPLTDGGRVTGSSTTNLTIANVQTNDAGNYQVVVTNSYGTAASLYALLTVLVPATITNQPPGLSVPTGTNVNLTVGTVGTAPLNYFWFSNSVALTNGGRISGATTATLTISNTQTNDTANYQVVITNNYGSATSTVAALTVFVPAQITGQPMSQAVVLGGNATFTVGATGAVPLYYQWYFNGAPLADGGRIGGSATASLTVSNVQPGDAGGYVVVVTNLVSAAASRTASLTPQTVAGPSVRYVALTSTNPSPPYLDWSTAATNIQNAVDAAVAGDVVLVSNGTYNVGARIVYPASTNRVVVDKAVTLQSVNGPAVTTIAGFDAAGISTTFYIRCAYLTNGAALSGFTLANGGAAGLGDLVLARSGGGVWCEGATAIISNCVFTANLASFYGGGVFRGTLYNCILTNNTGGFGGAAASNQLINCTLITNSAGFQTPFGGGAYYCTLSNCLVALNACRAGVGGGGAYGSTLTGCVISNNTAGFGAGALLGVLTNCLLVTNHATQYGGGACSNVVNNCTFTNNFAEFGGAAAYATMSHCLVVNNRAQNNGGGIYAVIADNCIFTRNTANGGTAAFNGSLTCCTVVTNPTPPTAGIAAVNGSVVTNCVVYDNPGGNIINSKLVAYTCTTPLPLSPGNFTNAPLFANEAAGDFHLSASSPCINSGVNVPAVGTADFDGNPRIVGGTVDLGAYEFSAPASVISYAWLLQYGLPTDGSVDYLDLDGTGMNNWQKWIAGLNPTNPASILAMQTAATATNTVGVVVTWQSVTNRTYYLQRGSDLTAQPIFSSLQSNLIGHTGTTSYTDTTATNGVPYFYRVGVQ